MEATHFIELWKRVDETELSCHLPADIDELDGDLAFTRNCRTLVTVAVWKIKPTDIPLQERLEIREAQRREMLRKVLSVVDYLDPREANF